MNEILSALRAAGGDTTAIEVKSAAGGYPATTLESIGALANTPGGGVIVFGLDERSGFTATGIYDVQALKQRLGNDAQDFVPHVKCSIEDDEIDGRPVVIANVAECDPSFKPCTHISGKSWVRSYDGDFQLSDLERQGFLSNRSAPHFDTVPVSGTTAADLDVKGLAAWREAVAREERGGLGRFSGDALLRHGGVMTSDGELTVAGLLMLGEYPQTRFPRHVVHVARVEPDGSYRNARPLSGSIPVMLDAAMDWVAANIDYTTVSGSDGHLRDVPTFPLAVVRELVGNALVHRDLAPWSEGIAINLRLFRDKLVITNPGGLYGVTVNRLGREMISRSRNATLVSLGVKVSAPGGVRVVESLASGLIRVNAQLDDHGLPRPRFIDTGIQFTVILSVTEPGRKGLPVRPGKEPIQLMGQKQQAVLNALVEGGELGVPEISSRTGLSLVTVRRAVAELRTKGLVVTAAGGRGRTTTYAAK
ncbi:hypothetical protein UG56_002010 [Nocardioides luteus]|uniref:HTH deoR-type domain-containing protein n=1 Tax=Nocardioides luteus TaxID=1844 RepID=A0A1J4NAQ9_9ACTN|nr:hypothetical protein UG56_002010 [Nocardioides luteus]